MFRSLATTNSISNKANSPVSKYKKYPELEQLDSRLKYISESIIHRTPYILTVPSDRPYKLDPRLPHDWKRGTPFEDHEEQLQYLSFLADWDHGLITPVGGWEAENGEIMDRSHSQQSARSATSTANSSIKKIKYSFSDYKRKAAAGQPLPTQSKDVENSAKVNGSSTNAGNDVVSSTNNAFHKRHREDGEISEDTDGTHSSKRRRSSVAGSMTPPRKRQPSPIPSIELPPDISPTLPAVFERELARLDKLEGLEDTIQVKPREASSSTTKQGDATSEKRKGFDKDAKLPKFEYDETNKPSAARYSQKDRETQEKHKFKDTGRLPATGPNGALERYSKASERDALSSHSRPRKIIKLRIPKSIRNNVIRLLKIPPRRPRPSETASKGIARRIDRLSPHSERPYEREKRRRDEEEEGDIYSTSVKRTKHPSGLDLSKPTTPLPGAFRSPVPSQQGSAQKPPATSDPHGKSLNVSQNELHASTPSAAFRNGTPTRSDSVERSNKERVSSNITSRAQRSLLYRELRQVEKDMNLLGRESKHSSDRELNSSDHEPSSRQTKRGLAFGLECILAFMLSYSVRDEMNRMIPPDGSTAEVWTTIFPYINRIKRIASTAEYSHLQGLCLQLEAVCHMAVWSNECERASMSSESLNISSLMKHYYSATNLFTDGAAALSIDALQHSFPRTWQAKSPIPVANRPGTSGSGMSNTNSSSHRFDPRPDGDFTLPITAITTGVEAVRAGRAVLMEWCTTEDVDWTPGQWQIKRIDPKEGRS